MKKIILTSAILLISAVLVQAETLEKFSQNYRQNGLDKAVYDSVHSGNETTGIVSNGLKIKEIKADDLVKALFCAGDESSRIVRASEQFKISDSDFAKGYKRSLTECGTAAEECGPCAAKAAAEKDPVGYREQRIATFQKDYQKSGLEYAVSRAVTGGLGLSDIIRTGKEIKGVTGQDIVQALNCSCADREDIRSVALRNGIREKDIDAGYAKSIKHCNKNDAVQAYTPIQDDPARKMNIGDSTVIGAGTVAAAATYGKGTANAVEGVPSSKNVVTADPQKTMAIGSPSSQQTAANIGAETPVLAKQGANQTTLTAPNGGLVSQDQFMQDANSKGVCATVDSAVKNGASAKEIISASKNLTDDEKVDMLTALYHSGASEDTIRASSEAAHFSDLSLVQAYIRNQREGCIDSKKIGSITKTPAQKNAPSPTSETRSVAGATEANTGSAMGSGTSLSTDSVNAKKFIKTFRDKGIEPAVIDAQKSSMSAEDVMKTALAVEGMNPQNLISVMYCAGYPNQDVLLASKKSNVSEPVVTAGYKRSIEVCKKTAADTQAYTPVSDNSSPTSSGGNLTTGSEKKAVKGEGAVLSGTGFMENLRSKGVDPAVTQAYKDGMPANSVVKIGMSTKDINPQNLVKSMYCAGYSTDAVKTAAKENNLSDVVVAAGYKKSIEECKDKSTESLGYTPVKSEKPVGNAPATANTAGTATPSTIFLGARFLESFRNKGLDTAVSQASQDGLPAKNLMKIGMALEGMKAQSLVTAMYCSGYSSGDIKAASLQNSISDIVLTAGYKKSQQDCGSARSGGDVQAYTKGNPEDLKGSEKLVKGGASSAAGTKSQMNGSGDPADLVFGQDKRQDNDTGSTGLSAEKERKLYLLIGDYLKTFLENYKKSGIDVAAELALKDGVPPDAVLETGLTLDDLNPQNLIKAMYCAGYKGNDIKKASDQFKVSDMILVAGFKKSREECSDVVTDTQAYTPLSGPSFNGVPSPGGGESFASPSTFP